MAALEHDTGHVRDERTLPAGHCPRVRCTGAAMSEFPEAHPVEPPVVHDKLEGAPKTAASVAGPGWMMVLSGLKTLLETGEPLAG